MTSAIDPDRLQKVYMTINVESDGPDPALNNLLELSCILHFENGNTIDELNIKFQPLPNRKPDKFTMENFWYVHREALNWVSTDTVDVETGMNLFINFYESYSKKYSIRFVGDPASRDFVWLQEYYTNYAMFSTIKLFPYCRCLTTMRKSYQKMLNLTDDESWTLKNKMQLGEDSLEINNNHIGLERARRQAREFCLLRQKMYRFQYNNQIRELNEFSQLVNFNLFNFKKEISTNINIIKNELISHFETLISLKIEKLKVEMETNLKNVIVNELENQKNDIIEQVKKSISNFKFENNSFSNTTKIIKNLNYMSSPQYLVPYSSLPSCVSNEEQKDDEEGCVEDKEGEEGE